MEKVVFIDSGFYGDLEARYIEQRAGGCPAIFGVCTILDSCKVDIPGCARHVPCSDTPCSDRPCSDNPCSDTPSSSASLTLSGGKGTLTWTISGLGNPFNATNYKSAGITSDKFTVGGVSSISGVVASKNAPSSGSSTTVSQTIDYPPGTYTFWGFAHTPSGGNPQYWPAGSDTVTVLPAFADFDWDYAGRNPMTGARISGVEKQSGLAVCVTAVEWNRLVDLVNEKKGTSIPHVSASVAVNHAASVTRVAQALGVTVTAWSTSFSASFFNQLRAAINSS